MVAADQVHRVGVVHEVVVAAGVAVKLR